MIDAGQYDDKSNIESLLKFDISKQDQAPA